MGRVGPAPPGRGTAAAARSAGRSDRAARRRGDRRVTTPFPPEDVKVHTIGELTRGVKGLLEEAFSPNVWVAGEVSNLKKHTSGHWYLTLRDKESQLQAAIFRGVNMRLKYDLQNGMEVIVRG